MAILKSVALFSVRLYYRLVSDTGVVFLGDGWPAKVRRLELYELDRVPYDDPGLFLYPYRTSSGKIIEKAYDISQWAEPPKAPLTPEHECEPESMEAGLWHIYNTYQAALAHRIKQVEAGEAYAHEVARHILANCLNERTRNRVKTPGDYEVIYQAAMSSEVTKEDLGSVLDSTFPGFVRFGEHIKGALEWQAKRLRASGRGQTVGSRDAPGVDAQQVPVDNAAAQGTG